MVAHERLCPEMFHAIESPVPCWSRVSTFVASLGKLMDITCDICGEEKRKTVAGVMNVQKDGFWSFVRTPLYHAPLGSEVAAVKARLALFVYYKLLITQAPYVINDAQRTS